MADSDALQESTYLPGQGHIWDFIKGAISCLATNTFTRGSQTMFSCFFLKLPLNEIREILQTLRGDLKWRFETGRDMNLQ